jgi:2-polyprenyl-3-methyl-5-hydroxy-6-metoxy-1,4-benzoquinol methylase
LGALTDRHTRTQRGSKPFEWYSAWRQLRPLFRAAVGSTAESPHGGRLLVVGCGNSELSAQLYDDGFTNIVNIDFSKVRAPRLL